MYNVIVFLVLFFWSFLSYSELSDFEISSKVYNNKILKFKPHRGAGPFSSYLVMDIQYQPISKLFEDLSEQLKASFNRDIHSRGEAHITVASLTAHIFQSSTLSYSSAFKETLYILLETFDYRS